MARVAGADIPDAKRVEIALTYVYGIGRTRSVQILAETKIDKNIREMRWKIGQADPDVI